MFQKHAASLLAAMIGALIVTAVGIGFIAGAAHGQELTNGQKNALRTAISTEPTLAAAYAARDDQTIANWCNAASATDAWMFSADSRTLFEAGDITKYDALAAGKRAAWDRMERNAPLDFGRNKLRAAVVDIWGGTDSVAVLTALREKATNCQSKIGGSSKTTNTVTAIDRAWPGVLSRDQISTLLNGD